MVDFALIFISVYGLTRLYSLYAPVIPYIFIAGAVFLIYQAYKIFIAKIDIEHLKDKTHLIEKIETREKGGFYTGFMINFLNPTLFIGALTSTFFVISLLAALGFHTGGLAKQVNSNLQSISKIEGSGIDTSKNLRIERFENIQLERRKNASPEPAQFTKKFHLAISICYAFFISAGSLLWFFLLAWMLVKFRRKINVGVINFIIRSLAIGLFLLGLFFAYRAFIMFSARGN